MGKAETATLRAEITTFKTANPEVSVRDICEKFGIKTSKFYYLMKDRAVEKKSCRKKEVEGGAVEEAEVGMLSLSSLIEKIKETLDYAQKVMAYQKKKAEELFL